MPSHTVGMFWGCRGLRGFGLTLPVDCCVRIMRVCRLRGRRILWPVKGATALPQVVEVGFFHWGRIVHYTPYPSDITQSQDQFKTLHIVLNSGRSKNFACAEVCCGSVDLFEYWGFARYLIPFGGTISV